MESNNGTSQARHRSPAYPGVSLRVAVDKVRVLYPTMKRNAISVESALESLGLKSSTGLRLIAALIMYGFLSDEGSGSARKVKFTQTGYRFNLLEEDDPECKEIIREAALSPKIYREMVKQWPESLPPDSTIRKYLTVDKGFNPETVSGLIKDFKDTYNFASLAGDDNLSDEFADVEEEAAETPVSAKRTGRSFYEANPSTQRQDEGRSEGVPLNKNIARAVDHSIPLQRDGMKTLTIQLPELREALLFLPPDYSLDDLESIKDHIELWSKLLKRPPKVNREPNVRFGKAMWQTADGDYPVVVTGYIGERDGRQYVRTEGSDTGVPLDELVYE